MGFLEANVWVSPLYLQIVGLNNKGALKKMEVKNNGASSQYYCPLKQIHECLPLYLQNVG